MSMKFSTKDQTFFGWTVHGTAKKKRRSYKSKK